MRALAGILVGSALGGVAARLGLTEVAAAKGKRDKPKKKMKRSSQAERQAPGRLQVERKRKGKKPNKKSPKAPKPKPCTDVFCDNGGRCCGGSCAAPGECCDREKKCGGGCIAETSCCPHYERTCPDGSCVALDACCFPDEMRCPDDSCAGVFECCPGEKECDGSCIPEDECCDEAAPLCDGCQKVACENGAYVCKTIHEGEDCGSGYCCPLDPPYFCAEVPGHGRMCCRPGYGGGAFVCV